MDITSWQQHTRVISGPSLRDFYERPICEIHAFLFETSQLELPRHTGSFSIKLVLSGEEHYLLGNRTIKIRPGDMLFINAGQSYGSRIRSPTRSLSLFFPQSSVAEMQHELRAIDVSYPDTASLTAPALREVPQFRFSMSKATWRGVLDLVRNLRALAADAADESAQQLMYCAWYDLQKLAPPSALAKVRKSNTRDELFGRIAKARDFIEDMRGIDCSLDNLATVACMSKFHFLRIFQDVVGTTPSAYARNARLRTAADAIARGEAVDRIARKTGYANSHSLIRAMRQSPDLSAGN